MTGTPFFLQDGESDSEDETTLEGQTESPGDQRKAAPGPQDESELSDGMLLRDLPKRTTFYDPVAERQMSQTDAKLFYQLSQIESQKPVRHPQSPGGEAAGGSSTVGSLELPMSAVGLNETFASPTRHTQSPMTYSPAQAQTQYAADRHDAGAASGSVPRFPPTSGEGLPAWASQHEPGIPGGLVGGLFTDTDPHITAELSSISKNIQKVRAIRNKYISLSAQGPDDNPKDRPDWNIYPPPPEPAWIQEKEQRDGSTVPNSVTNNPAKKRKQGEDIGEDFNMDDLLPLPPASDMTFKLDEGGVYQIYEKESDMPHSPWVNVPTIREFYMDLDEILSVSSDGPTKTFAFRRLQYLEGQFNMYALLNGYQETADSKRVPHRDFYNVRKVDTHVHHSACMNQKHLLRFIKSKMKKSPDEVVLFRDGRHLTLAEVFDSINLTAYDLSIDTLDMHAHIDSFHRFDKFNLKYNPIGESRLRTIFLKTDNFINGRYLAEITKEVIMDIESSKYQMVEWRISIYGKSLDEWDKLAAWVVDNKLFSHNVRWLIQIPRLYDVYKASGLMESYEQVVRNVFQPLFEVTKDPSSHPKLHVFLQRVIGFDSVDDESKIERRLFKKFPVPREWKHAQNPPYSYWIYYLFANVASLNQWRKRRGFNTLVLRPHCGEAGDSEHLAVAALSCHSISHGLLLRKVPLLQYIYYLEQIGIAMSPLSNNALFLAYERNPFHQYFRRGLNVSLSTDDPLQFAFTKEPLIEEYAVAAQIYKLSPVDMCELAKNSVKQSGYEFTIKQQWLGPDFEKPGKEGNKVDKTNVPDRREEFRHQVLQEERDVIQRYVAYGEELDAKAAAATPGPSPMIHGKDATQTDKAESSVGQSSVGQSTRAAPVGDAALGVGAVPWPADTGAGVPSLSGSEPKIFPGLVSQGQRRNSVRQGDDGKNPSSSS